RHGRKELTRPHARERRHEQPPPCTFTQCVVGLQPGTVESQPGTQLSIVDGSPSSQKPAISTFWQPNAASQESAVHAAPSSQKASLGTFWHSPVDASHESTVHATPSSQRGEC